MLGHFYTGLAGWPDIAGSLAQADSVQCSKPLRIDGEEFWDQVRFQYPYQDDKWMLVQLLRTQYARLNWGFYTGPLGKALVDGFGNGSNSNSVTVSSCFPNSAI